MVPGVIQSLTKSALVSQDLAAGIEVADGLGHLQDGRDRACQKRQLFQGVIIIWNQRHLFIVFVRLGLGGCPIAGHPPTPAGRAASDSILEVGTVLLRQMAVSEILIGLLVALGASLIGPARYAKWVRGYSAKGFRRAAVATWVGFAVVILAVIAWTPIIATSSWLTVLIVLILVVVGIEAIRRTSLAEEATLLESEAAIEVAHADAGTDES